MKRLILITAAAASLAATLPLGELALAQGRGHRSESQDRGRGNDHRGGDRGDHGGRWEGRRDQGQGERRGSDERRGRWEAERRGDPGEGRRFEDRPPPYPVPGERREAPRRGGYMGEPARGAYVDDYQRYRLRPPPRGFAWVRTGNGYALMSLSDGRVFDVIPY